MNPCRIDSKGRAYFLGGRVRGITPKLNKILISAASLFCQYSVSKFRIEVNAVLTRFLCMLVGAHHAPPYVSRLFLENKSCLQLLPVLSPNELDTMPAWSELHWSLHAGRRRAPFGADGYRNDRGGRSAGAVNILRRRMGNRQGTVARFVPSNACHFAFLY